MVADGVVMCATVEGSLSHSGRSRHPRKPAVRARAVSFSCATAMRACAHSLAARCARVLHEPSAQEKRGRGECRAHGAPAASCAKVESTRVVTTGPPKTPGIPARNGFNGFLRALPGDRAFLSPSPADCYPQT